MKLITKKYIKFKIKEVILNFDFYSIKLYANDFETLEIGNVSQKEGEAPILNSLKMSFNKNIALLENTTLYSVLKTDKLNSIDLIFEDMEVHSLYIPFKPSKYNVKQNEFFEFVQNEEKMAVKINKN